jgi:hypothetical protein
VEGVSCKLPDNLNILGGRGGNWWFGHPSSNQTISGGREG